ncbi:glycosyltransferase [Herbaspirillum sp. RTI4]|uniref:glycosyltransferase family 8 protein n=2 Tax=Oxalobacteraceae TaxID=75682 RepID=UPI002AB4721B|nr:glycosyltransferase [Herbaspirillum sp. RTI4]MDY7580016.1 glycosyltransferase [Herbaspirillum sp. RTI4]MEA9982830.1 glycosyltransferase [Herbaspirillum sp. RTI4]
MNGHVNPGVSEATDALYHHVAFCIDNRYFRAMGATIASLIAHNPDLHFHFHILAFEVADEHRQRVDQLQQRLNVLADIHLIDANQFTQFAPFVRSTYYSPSIFTRLLIPEVLKEVAAKVLYLDADILCVGDVRELLEADVSEEIALVVPDAEATTKRRVAALHLKGGDYFNSGVMLINVQRWLAAEITQATIASILKDGKSFRFPDQDALNVVLDGRVKFIERKWNFLHGLVGDLENGRYQMRPLDDARLVHFAGSVKPWSNWTLHASTQLFARHHAQSPWSDMDMDEIPQNYKEMRMYALFLKQRGKYYQSFVWFVKYLCARPRG